MSTHELEPKFNPINGKNLVSKTILPPFNNLRVNQLPTKEQFDSICGVHTIIHTNGNATTVLLQNLSTSGYSIGKIYNCSDTNPKLIKSKLNSVWKEYQIVKHCGLNEYFGIYFDCKTHSLIVHQQAYECTLNQYITRNQNLYLQELKCKIITKQLLLCLWRLHNSHYIHTDIKPDNIMNRQLDHLYKTSFIKDGWLLIDFNEIKKNKSKGHYVGTMGWSAPEIEYNSDKNVYTYSSDIFAFGLIILFILFGKQPLTIPNEQRDQYRINADDNKHEILQKKVLRKQILTNWYYGHVRNSENMMKTYLKTLYSENKISLQLYNLLNDGILCYDPKKRFNCKKIYNSQWLKNV
eukprot:111158_1